MILYDMKRAFVEITDDKIIAVDYYFGLKHEKVFSKEDIVFAEIITGYSMKIRGYRFSGNGFSNLKYIVFRGKNKKYLLKLIYSNEIKSYVEKHFEIVNTQSQKILTDAFCVHKSSACQAVMSLPLHKGAFGMCTPKVRLLFLTSTAFVDTKSIS